MRNENSTSITQESSGAEFTRKDAHTIAQALIAHETGKAKGDQTVTALLQAHWNPYALRLIAQFYAAQKKARASTEVKGFYAILRAAKPENAKAYKPAWKQIKHPLTGEKSLTVEIVEGQEKETASDAKAAFAKIKSLVGLSFENCLTQQQRLALFTWAQDGINFAGIHADAQASKKANDFLSMLETWVSGEGEEMEDFEE